MKHPIIKAKNLQWFKDFDGENKAIFRILFPNGIVLNKNNLKIAYCSWCQYSILSVFEYFLDTKTHNAMNKELKKVDFWKIKKLDDYKPWTANSEEAEVFYRYNKNIDILYKYVPKLKIK